MTHATFWKKFNCHCDPFINTNRSAVYINDNWQEYLDLLQHFSHYSHTLFMITGGMDSGKSTLVDLFQERADGGNYIYRLEADADLTLESLLRQLPGAYNLPENNDLNYMQADDFETQMRQLKDSPFEHLLILDDAHHLSETTLESIINLVSHPLTKEAKLHFILVGDIELRPRVMRLIHQTTAEELVHALELKPLGPDQTHAYIEHCLRQAGLEHSPFTQKDIERIYQLSQGFFGRTNRVARQMLIAKSQKTIVDEPEPPIPETGPRPFKLIGMGMAAALLAVVGYTVNHTMATAPHSSLTAQHASRAKFPERLVPSAPHEVTQKPRSIHLVDAKPLTAPHNIHHRKTPSAPRHTVHNTSSPLLHGSAHRVSGVTTKSSGAPASLKKPFKPEKGIVIATIPMKPQGIASHRESGRLIASQKAHRAHVPAPHPVSLDAGETGRTYAVPASAVSTAKPSSVRHKPVVTVSAKPAIKHSAPKKSATRPLPKQAKHRALKQHHRAPSVQSKAKRERRHYAKQEARLLSKTGSHYTLQLLGSFHQAKIEAYIRQHHLQHSALVYQSHYKGRPWYVVTVGDFKRPEAAKSAIRKLPRLVQKSKPWINRYASIQHILNREYHRAS